MEGTETAPRLLLAGHTKTGPPRVAVSDGRFKLILTTGPDSSTPVPLVPAVPERRLYDLRADPGETRDLVESHPELVQTMERALRQMVRWPSDGRSSGVPTIDDEALRERLESLGYLK